MSRSSAERKSVSEVARERAAIRDLIPGLAVLVVTQGTLIVLDPDTTSSAWHLAWALSPLIGIGLLVWGQVRILRRSDERERLAQLAAMALGFGVFAVSLAVVGVLQGADLGNPIQQTQITFAVGIVAWVVALEVDRRRTS